MHHAYPSFRGLRQLLTLGLAVAGAGNAFAQAPTPIPITGATVVYRQDFDGLTATGTAFPTGWAGLRLAGTGLANESLAPVPADGSANAGAVYNVGTAGTTDRALGTISSGSTAPAFGAVFINQTGGAVTQLNLAARLEQWRSASNNTVAEVSAFEYSLDATSLSSGTWTAVPALDLLERATASTVAGALDGNLPANSAAISGTISLTWPATTTLWIRWRDTDNIGADALLAVDNFALSTGATPLSSRSGLAPSDLTLYPNPAGEALYLRVNGRSRPTRLEVTDLMGRTLLRGQTSEEGTFSLRGLPPGVYLVTGSTGIERFTRKVVKQ